MEEAKEEEEEGLVSPSRVAEAGEVEGVEGEAGAAGARGSLDGNPSTFLSDLVLFISLKMFLCGTSPSSPFVLVSMPIL